MQISSPGWMCLAHFIITFCLSSYASLALYLNPVCRGNSFACLKVQYSAVLNLALLKTMMSLILEAGHRPITQYYLSIQTNLSYQSNILLYEDLSVTIEPQYSEIVYPGIKLSVANRPRPGKGSFVCFIYNLSKSESGYSQKGSRTSLAQFIRLRCFDLVYNYMQNQASDVSKQEIESTFSELFQDPFNTVCFECGRKTKQWVQTDLAIFLCLTCAGIYKAASEQINIKCINLDAFTSDELKFIKKGGNTKLKDFLSNYELQEYIYRQKLQTKAVAYYRIMLREEFHGRVAPMAPDIEAGREFASTVKKLTEMSPGEVLEELSSKAKRAGQTAMEYGGKAISKVHDKFTSGELKEGAIHMGESISTTAKSLWHKITSTVDTLKAKELQEEIAETEKKESKEPESLPEKKE